MKYTQSNLDKLQGILGESDYVVRYERGTFQSGWCLLQQKRVVVLNKFLNVEGRINTLMEIIPQLDIEYDRLTHESQKLYETLKKRAAELLSESEAAGSGEATATEEAIAAAAEDSAAPSEAAAAAEDTEEAGAADGTNAAETPAAPEEETTPSEKE